MNDVTETSRSIGKYNSMKNIIPYGAVIIIGYAMIALISSALSIVFIGDFSGLRFYTYLTSIGFAILPGFIIILNMIREKKFELKVMYPKPTEDTSILRFLLFSRFTLLCFSIAGFMLAAIISLDGFVTMNG